MQNIAQLMSIQIADEILPGLWLGNVYASRDENWLNEKNINVIFNCTKDLPCVSPSRQYYRVPVDDNLQRDEIRNLQLWSFEVVFKIAQEYNSGKRLLVHCAAGMQRSAACLAMFLIAITRCTAEQAITFIRSKRSIAFTPGANFFDSIKGFEGELRSRIGDSVSDPDSPWKKLPLPM